jgi:hypothetical protein
MKCSISVSLVSQREGASSRGGEEEERCVLRGRSKGQEKEDMRCVLMGLLKGQEEEENCHIFMKSLDCGQ